MTNGQKEDLAALVAECLRSGYYLDERGGEFYGQIYADYRDEMNDETAGKILDAEDPLMEFEEKIYEWYDEAAWSNKCEIMDGVKKELNDREDLFPDGLDAEQEEFVEELIRDIVWFEYPEDHFLDQDIDVNLMLDTGDGNYDFVLNSVAPCWYGHGETRIDEKASLLWLARQQGYTKTQLQNALKGGDMADPHGFLESVRVELANLPSHMSTVTFLVRMPFHQLLEIRRAMNWRDAQGKKYDARKYPYCGYIVLGKRTMCGLYDPWAGGGSVLEIELEKDVRLPIKYIWRAVPDGAKGYGYQVGDVYGMCGSAWQETLKEIHTPKKFKEAVS